MPDRRSVLLGLGALLAAPAVVRASSLMRVAPPRMRLWADGVHDDTAALQSFLDGESVQLDGRRVWSTGRDICFPRGTYFLSETLTVVRHGGRLIFQPGKTVFKVAVGYAPVLDLAQASALILDGDLDIVVGSSAP